MDAEDCALANYQALVALVRQFTGKQDSAGKPKAAALAPLSIKVFEYPTFPIVGTLGLIPDICDKTGPYPIYTLRPIDSFLISGEMFGNTGLEMCVRVGTDWRRNATFDAAIAKIKSPKANKPNPQMRRKRK